MTKINHWILLLAASGLASLSAVRAQSPSNTYNWDAVFSGSMVVPAGKLQLIPLTGNLTVVVHNNGTNAFSPATVAMETGVFSGSNRFALYGLGSSLAGMGSIAPSSSGTATFTPLVAFRTTGTGAKIPENSTHAITVDGCDDTVFVAFNPSGSWVVTGTGALNTAGATFSPAGPTVHIYRNGLGGSERPGVAGVSSGALDLHIDIGSAGPDGDKMSLELRAKTLDAGTAKASRFAYIGAASGSVQLLNGGEGRRQFVSPSGLANLEDIKDGSNNYLHTELSFYHEAGTKTGRYFPGVGSPYKTITFTYGYDNSTHVDSLAVEEAEGGTPEETVYEYDRDTEQWTLVTDKGERKEKLSQVVNSGTRTVTREVLSGSNVLLSKEREIYKTFAWGEELVQRISDPDGQALTTTWSYGITFGANDYKQLIKTKDERGHWREFEYDNKGRVTKTVTQFLDAADTATESQSRVLTTTYTGEDSTEVETLLGQEIGRRYLLWSGTNGSSTLRVEQCVTPGASPGASDSLVTTKTYLRDGVLIVQPDATITKTTTTILGSGSMRITTEAGQAGASGTSVTAGRSRVVEKDARGNVMLDTTRDIASNLVIAEATATATDDFGRATAVSYLDGTSESFQYGCCGLEQKTDRSGLVTTYQHDAFENIEYATTAGVTINTQYDALGRLRRVYRVGSDSSSILKAGMDFNLAGQPVTLLSASGSSSISYASGSTGIQTATKTLPDGATLVITNYPDRKLKEIGGTSAFPTTYAYGVDSANGLSIKKTLVGESGATSEWVKTYFDLLSRPWKVLYADNASAVSYWNTKGQRIRSVDPDGVTLLYGYSDQGLLEDVALDANGNSQIDYSGSDRISRSRISFLTDNGQTVVRRTNSAWKESGEFTTAETDDSRTSLDVWQRSFGREIHLATTLSGSGAFTTTSSASTGRTVTQTYAQGRLANVVVTGSSGENAGSQSFQYDPHGRVEETATDGLAPFTYTYYDTDLVHTATQDGNAVTFEYDSRGNRKKITRAGGKITEFDYYPTGLLEKISGDLAYPVEYVYTPQGRLKTLRTHGAAGDAVTTWNYNSRRGWLDNKRYANNKGPDFTYTAAGRLETRKWARSGTTGGRLTAAYDYTGLGELDAVAYSDGSPGLDYSYDRLGRSTDITQGGATYHYAWADDGQMTGDSITGGPLAGIGTTFGYDALGRLDEITVQSGTASFSSPYTYDGASRLKTGAQGDLLATYQYVNGSSRIDKTEFRHSGTLTAYTQRGYDNRGRFDSIATKRASGDSVISSFAYLYNDLNQRTKATLEDGSRWDYGYDDLGQLNSATRAWSDNSAVLGQQYAYEYDTIGNRTSTTVNGRTAEYTPNILNQYTAREVPGMIDVIGSATSSAVVTVNGSTTARQGDYFYRALTINNTSAPQYPEVKISAEIAGSGTTAGLQGQKTGNVFLPQASEQYVYDEDGNLLHDGRFAYTWDAENRLVGIESHRGGPIDSWKKAAFGYDPFGRRIQKQTRVWSAPSNGYQVQEDTRFLYAGWNLVAETGGSLGLVRDYLWGQDLSNSFSGAGGVGGLLGTIHFVSGEQTVPAYDGSGNVVAALDSAVAEIRARFDYDPYGNEVRASGKLAGTSLLRFSSKYWNAETGDLYFGNRYLNGSVGRWMNRDPIFESGGANLYGFVGNSPINFIDPFGNYEADPAQLAAAVAALEALATKGSISAPVWPTVAAATGVFAVGAGVGVVIDNIPIGGGENVGSAVEGFWFDAFYGPSFPPLDLSDPMGDFWRRMAQNYTEGEWSEEDLQRMRKGLPPFDPTVTPSESNLCSCKNREADLRTGVGYDAGDAPVRLEGPWTINDLKQGLLGHPPSSFGSPDIHHGGQMPGGAKHEIIPGEHRNNSMLHLNDANQGVTKEMRQSDRQLHWWYRAQEQGACDVLPDWIYGE